MVTKDVPPFSTVVGNNRIDYCEPPKAGRPKSGDIFESRKKAGVIAHDSLKWRENPFQLPCSVQSGSTAALQIQIEQTKIGLEKIGVEVEAAAVVGRNAETGDILHHFRPGSRCRYYGTCAKKKGMKVRDGGTVNGAGIAFTGARERGFTGLYLKAHNGQTEPGRAAEAGVLGVECYWVTRTHTWR